MSVAGVIVLWGTVSVAVAVALFLSLTAAGPEAARKQRLARARDLERYRHHPDANLLSLND